MRVAFYVNIVSPHQLPLALEVSKRVGSENFRYVYAERLHAERSKMGWSDRRDGIDFKVEHISCEACREWVENADVLLCGLREVELFERRSAKGLKTFYTSERWFKPPLGAWRMFSASYRATAGRLVALLRNDLNFKYLAIGPWAAKDMMLLCRLFHPVITRRRAPGTKIIPWGYFVAPGCRTSRPVHSPLRVLCVGRLLKLKHFETVIRAVAHLNLQPQPSFTLTILGGGPEESPLKKLANSTVDIDLQPRPNPIFTFHPAIPIAEVRAFMREHDVLVFSSNGYDGWGAVVSEALEEGLRVLGTYEAGAPAAMLPKACLFHCGDWRRLAKLLVSDIPQVDMGVWSVESAAERLLAL